MVIVRVREKTTMVPREHLQLARIVGRTREWGCKRVRTGVAAGDSRSRLRVQPSAICRHETCQYAQAVARVCNAAPTRARSAERAAKGRSGLQPFFTPTMKHECLSDLVVGSAVCVRGAECECVAGGRRASSATDRASMPVG